MPKVPPPPQTVIGFDPRIPAHVAQEMAQALAAGQQPASVMRFIAATVRGENPRLSHEQAQREAAFRFSMFQQPEFGVPLRTLINATAQFHAEEHERATNRANDPLSPYR